MPEDGQILRLITLDEARRREGDRDRTTQWRERLDDPSYPEVIVRGRRRYLVEHEHQAYLARLIERARRGAGPAKPERRARSSPRERVRRRPGGDPGQRRDSGLRMIPTEMIAVP